MTGATPESATTPSNVDRMSTITADLIERGAPWSPRATWRLVLVQGIVAIVLGLAMLFRPFGGTSTTLQIVGLILLLAALVTTFQVWRGSVQPERVAIAAFRAGSGVTVGLLVIVATFLTNVTAEVTASLSVAVGVGLLFFGLSGVATAFVARRQDEALPLAGIVANAVIVVAGIVLTFAGAAGSSTVNTIYSFLGILLILAGGGLCAYAYLLHQQEAHGVRT